MKMCRRRSAVETRHVRCSVTTSCILTTFLWLSDFKIVISRNAVMGN